METAEKSTTFPLVRKCETKYWLVIFCEIWFLI